MNDDDHSALAYMLTALGKVPKERRMNVMAMFLKIFVERPDYIDVMGGVGTLIPFPAPATSKETGK